MKFNKLKQILTLTAPLLLYGATRAFAAASGLPADGPVTTFVNVRRVGA